MAAVKSLAITCWYSRRPSQWFTGNMATTTASGAIISSNSRSTMM